MGEPARAPEIEALFLPAEVRAYTSQVNAELIAELRDEERVAIERMVVTRQAEFATARACARAALADLGHDAGVPRGAGGAPSWPNDVTGSISHTRGFCVAVASAATASIGIDVEEIARMKPAIERRILVDGERELLEGVAGEERNRRVASMFAAKEAFYKAHYEIEPRYLGFDAVEIAVDERRGVVRFRPSSGAVRVERLERTSGRLMVHQGRVFVGVLIDTSGQPGPLPSPA